MEIKIQVKVIRNRSAFTVTTKHIDCCVGNGVYSAKRGAGGGFLRVAGLNRKIGLFLMLVSFTTKFFWF